MSRLMQGLTRAVAALWHARRRWHAPANSADPYCEEFGDVTVSRISADTYILGR